MNRKLLLIPAVLLAAALVAVSVNRSQKLKSRSDYNVYYTAGQHFAHGQALYEQDENVRNFYYPPFAAFLFQAMTVVPLKISANIFFLINALVLFPLAVWLIFGILVNLGFDYRKIRVPVILATVASLKFFWNNLTMFQMNFVIFTLVLAGLWYMSRRKDATAAVIYTVAAFIKVLPVFFTVYIFGVRRSRKVFLAIAITGIFCVLAPALQRGLSAGYADHLSYYETFLKDFKQGKVITKEVNHTLRSFTLKAFVPAARDTEVYPGQYPGTFRITSIILLLMLAAMTAAFAMQARRGNHAFTPAGIAVLFIFTHLFSGISWTAHYVTSMFYYLPLFLIDYRRLNIPVRIFHFLLMAMVFFLAVEGSDTTGRTIYDFIRTYDIFVVVPLLLFTYYMVLMISGKEWSLYRGLSAE